MHVSDDRGFVQRALFPARHPRALGPFNALHQFLHDAPPGHGGFKFRPRRLHLLPVKCDFGVLRVGQFSQMTLILIQHTLSCRLKARPRSNRRLFQHAAPVLVQFSPLMTQRRVFAPNHRQRLALEVFLTLPHAQKHGVTFG